MTFKQWWDGVKDVPAIYKYEHAEAAWKAALNEAAKIAESNILAPQTQWEKGAAYNADKIAKAIRAL